MKKILAFLCVFPMLICNSPSKSVINRPMSDFTIYTTKTHARNEKDERKTIEFGKEIALVEHKQGNWYFNEIKETTTKDGWKYFEPALDKNGNPVRISGKDPEYELKVLRTFKMPSLSRKIKEKNISEFLVGSYDLKNKNEKYPCIAYKINNSGDIVFNMISFGFDQIKHFKNPKAFFFLDDHFNYEELVFKDKTVVVSRRLALNPNDENQIKDIPFQKVIDKSQYIWKYLYAKVGTQFGDFNGRKLLMNLIEIKNGKAMVNSNEFVSILRGIDDFNYETKEYIVKVCTAIFKYARITELQIKLDSKEVLVDGQKEFFNSKPYYDEEDNIIWLPLTDLCKFLRIKYYWREMDNSVLIELF